MDNYESETGLPEEVTYKEKQETGHFLDLIVETPVMQVGLTLLNGNICSDHYYGDSFARPS